MRMLGCMSAGAEGFRGSGVQEGGGGGKVWNPEILSGMGVGWSR